MNHGHRETGLIFMDVAKTFDKVSHRGLLHNSGSLLFTGRILFYLLCKGCYHIGIRNDRNCMAYK